MDNVDGYRYSDISEAVTDKTRSIARSSYPPYIVDCNRNMYISGSMSNKALGTQFHNQVIPQFVQLRKKRKISQLEMDEILGVAKGLVSKWECGIRKPSGWLFCCWAEALGAEIMLKEKNNGS